MMRSSTVRMRSLYTAVASALAIAVSTTAQFDGPIDLSNAANHAMLAKAVTVGIFPGTVTGEIHVQDAEAQAAIQDAEIAEYQITLMGPDADLTGQNLGGLIIYPRVAVQ
ncbi:hypothetical protein B0H66DRAFT_641875 [Apodospora peruviana]|uniref:Uncharacterized protein n=1 Tax=Apodospora peruviana TaxID=516989 RepID=A0AAE0M0A0_9PEZI|nr:hypothetical protein B0H66DRAFT_641875 [Apodospora peruviana]